MRRDGMGALTALVPLCERGDVTRLSASRKGGADGRYRHRRASPRPRRRVGKLTRQGLPAAAPGAL
jgi:hypothetical protein